MLAQRDKSKKISKEDLVKLINAQFNQNDDEYGASANSVMSDGSEEKLAVSALAKAKSRKRRSRS